MTARTSGVKNITVLRATQVQQRSVAFATALILLCVGFLANRHEAEAAHVRERSGRVVHAQALAEHHEVSASAHLHGREVHAHLGECALHAITHAPVVHAAGVVVVTPVESTATLVAASAPAAGGAIAAYRLAPKTSPPST